MPPLVCVITGATSGIGRAAALALGAAGANLILAGRNETAGASLVKRIHDIKNAGTANFLPFDLAEPEQVRAAAQTINGTHDHVDVLINNAGARHDRYLCNSVGIERTFAANHLGHFLLTCLLLDRLMSAPSARVITVSSGSHGSADINGNWSVPAEQYNRRQAYARSKLANVLFAYSLAKQLRNTRVASNAYDPGGVASNFCRNNGLISWMRHLLSHALRRELVSSATAAAGIIHLALSPDVNGLTGKYFRGKAPQRSSGASYDERLADSLWDTSVRLARLDFSVGSIRPRPET